MTDIVGYRLSPQQRRSWLDPDAVSSVSQCVVSIEGPCSMRALEAGLQRVVERHESLRTWFQSLPEMALPLQVVAEAARVPLQVEEPARESVAGEESIQEMLWRLAAASDVPGAAGAPLFRVSARAQGRDRALLVLSVPSILADLRSLEIIVEELAVACGRAGAGGLGADTPVQYADYAEWANELLASDDAPAAAARAWWASHRQPVAVLLPWRSGSAAAGQGAHAGRIHVCELPRETAEQLLDWCGKHDVTPRGALLAAWHAVIDRSQGHSTGRSTGSQGVCIGCELPREAADGIEGSVGPFARRVPYIPAASDERSLVEAARAAEQTLGRAWEAQPYYTSSPGDPDWQVPFHFDYRESRTSFGNDDLSLRIRHLASTRTDFDLKLVAVATGAQLGVAIHGAAAKIDPGSVARMAERLRTLLASAAARPDACLGEQRVVGPDETRQVAVLWNQSEVEIGPVRSLPALFAAQVERHPERRAVVCGATELGYAALDQRANRLAAVLVEQGVARGDIVALSLPRSLSLVVAALGVSRAGAAFLPLDRHQPPERLHRILDDARPKRVIATEALAAALNREWQEKALLIAPTGELPSASAALPLDHPMPGPDDLAYVMYTSGSTGMPKGVMVEHASVANLRAALDRAVYAPVFGAGNDRQLQVSMNAPLSFDASIKQMIGLLNGHCLHILDDDLRRDGDALLGYLQTHGLDVLDCTPSQLKLLRWAGFFGRSDVRPGAQAEVRPAVVLVGGEPIDRELWDQLARAEKTTFFNVYGPTECTVDTTIGEITPEAAEPHIGRPIANARVYILDASQRIAPVGAVGELHIAGAGVARGYHNDPALTAARFVSWSPDDADDQYPTERLYRTGDLARFLPDGALVFVGRRDRQVKVRGYRVELGEIEEILRWHPSVGDVAVVAQATNAGVVQLVAYARIESDADAGDLRAHVGRHLPDYMIPSKFIVVPALPLTANGKIDYRELAQLETRHSAQRESYVAPASELERSIAAIWRSVLNIDVVGVQDNFFDLGGHSLLLPVVQSELERALDVQLPVAKLLEYPTIRSLVAHLSAEDERDPAAAGDVAGARRRAARALARRTRAAKPR